MRNKLISSLAAATFSFAVSGVTFAADMPVKAPPLAPAPVYTWTGWYVGGNVGYSWGDARTDIAGSGTSSLVIDPAIINSLTLAGSARRLLNGVIGGGQIGFNYQFSPKWVLGFEADIQASGEQGSHAFVDPFSTIFCEFPSGIPGLCHPNLGIGHLNGTAVTGYEAKIGWFGTVRGRVGVLVTDQIFVYGTGGLAYGQVSITGNATVNGSLTVQTGQVFPITAGTSAFSASKTNVGFTVGGGIEGKFAYWLSANWTWKLEYLYIDLGSLDTMSPFPPATQAFIGATPFAGPFTTHTRFTDNIVRVGLNYHFH